MAAARHYGARVTGITISKSQAEMARLAELTFFHELAHAAHNRIAPLKPGQAPTQEIVAETAAAALCLIYGFEPAYQSSAKNYVASYAGATPEQACRAVMGCLSEIQKVLDLILSTSATAEAPPGEQSDAA